MTIRTTRGVLVRLLSLAIVSAGLAPYSFAGVIGTEYVAQSEAHAASTARVEAFLARSDVAEQFVRLGVDREMVEARLAGLTSEELLSLERHIDEQIAGGDALSLIGAVFLVLLILELVGVTDIFKSV